MEETAVEKTFFDKFKSVMLIIGRAIRDFFKKPLVKYMLKRILGSLITLVLLVFVVIILLRCIPEDYLYDISTYNKIKRSAGIEAANNYANRQLYFYGRKTITGKNVPVFYSIFQYLYWILPIPKNIPVAWDEATYTTVIKSKHVWSYFGESMKYSKPVTRLLKERMGISFRISIISLLLSYIISYPLGVAMAKKPGGIVDKIGNAFVVLNYAIPALVFYMIIQKWMGNSNGMFGKLFGYVYKKNNPLSLFPPIFALVFLSIPGITIWVRRFMLDEMSSDYVKFARSKGLSENRIMYTHVLRNACVPLVRSIPAAFIGAIIGSYYVEKLWNIPGTGQLLLTGLSLQSPDVMLVQALTIIYSGLSMISFLLGDIVTVLIDPRIKLEK